MPARGSTSQPIPAAAAKIKASKAASVAKSAPVAKGSTRTAAAKAKAAPTAKSAKSARSTRTAAAKAKVAPTAKSAGRGSSQPPIAPEPGGKPASRRALRSQGRRTMRKLLDASMEAFDQRGYHATRVNDVVEIAETSHGTFYLYFSNKEDLLRALVGEVAAEAAKLYTTMADLPAGSTDRQHLREWVGNYSSLWARYGPLMRAWTDLAVIDTELSEQVRRSMSSMSDALAVQIRAYGPAEGIDADAAAMAVLAMLDRFHYLRQFVGQPVDEVALDTLTTMVHRALFDEVASPRR